jgi:hypothetical protein
VVVGDSVELDWKQQLRIEILTYAPANCDTLSNSCDCEICRCLSTAVLHGARAASMNIGLVFLWHLLLHLRIALAVDGSEDLDSRPPPYDEAFDNGTYGYYPVRVYATEDHASPQTNFLQWNPRCDDGLLYFITPRGWGIPDPGPMILDGRGNLVWTEHFDNKFGGQAYGLMVQEYMGQDYLTFWLGDDRVRGHGAGSYYMVWMCSRL